MACYIVAFEVSSANRSALEKALQSYSSYCPINANCWAIISDKKPIDIANHLKATMASTDRVFVIRSGTDAAWTNAYGEKNSDWLKKQL